MDNVDFAITTKRVLSNEIRHYFRRLGKYICGGQGESKSRICQRKLRVEHRTEHLNNDDAAQGVGEGGLKTHKTKKKENKMS